ncbi:MAG: hypothetical protein WAW09_08520 [Smithella sp.]|jgi:hypothetical protein
MEAILKKISETIKQLNEAGDARCELMMKISAKKAEGAQFLVGI